MPYGKKENSKINSFRCKVGGEWKPLDSFSNTQRRLIQRQIDNRSRIDAANSGMTCRDHSAVCRTDICCELCGLLKPADNFSRNSRKNGDNICKRCCAWGETQEPEVTPAPLQTGHISVEEERLEVWQYNYIQSTDFFRQDSDQPQAPVTELSALGLEDHEVPSQMRSGPSSNAGSVGKASSIMSAASVPTHTSLSWGSQDGSASQTGRQSDASSIASFPPHLKEKLFQSSLDDGTSNSFKASAAMGFGCMRAPSVSGSEAASRSTSCVPPHLRGRLLGAGPLDMLHTASENGDATQRRGPESVSTATTLREERERGQASERVLFNAWGPDGTAHWRSVESPSGPSSTDGGSSASAAEMNDTHGSSEWTKVETKQLRGRDKWCKGPRLPRSELCKPEPTPHIQGVDADIDRQRHTQFWWF